MGKDGDKEMTKCSIIGAIGKSAPVMTELVEWLIEVKKEFVSDVVLLVTDDEEVWKQGELVVSALELSDWDIHVHWRELPFKDVTTDEDNFTFLKKTMEAIYEEKSKHDADRIYLNVAGGRKTMTSGLHFLSQFNPVDGVYHVVSPQIGLWNQKLEQNKDKIDEFFHASDLNRYYEKNKKTFNEILFPEPTEFEVISMPVLPYPQRVLESFKKVWRSDSKIERSKIEGLTDNDIYRAASFDLLKYKDGWVYPTKLGKKLLGIMS